MKILLKNLQRRRRLNISRIKKSARRILTLTERPAAELSILFVGDKRMSDMNARYRGIPKSTDVLSFEAGIPVKGIDYDPVIGDIVICVPKAESQAEASGTDFYNEIERLMVHGILHLTGYDHEKSAYKARIMRKREKEILDAVKKMD